MRLLTYHSSSRALLLSDDQQCSSHSPCRRFFGRRARRRRFIEDFSFTEVPLAVLFDELVFVVSIAADLGVTTIGVVVDLGPIGAADRFVAFDLEQDVGDAVTHARRPLTGLVFRRL